MAYDLSGVDVFFLVKELKSLEGAKVDKITQIDRKLFTIRFFGDKKKTLLRILVPDLVNITEQKYESPALPMGFCSFLRKYLQNTKLNKVSQKDFERIVVFEFSSLKYGELLLILELFKPGNMVLCRREKEEHIEGEKEKREKENENVKEKDSENKNVSDLGKLIILNALERQEFKARKISAREEYSFPPPQNNPLFMGADEIKKISDESEKPLGKLLATELSLGGAFAEEIIKRAGLDKTSKSISSQDAENLRKTIASFFSEKIVSGKAKERIYPVFMRSVNAEETFDSFNKGLDSLKIETSVEIGKTAEHKKKKSKTEALLDIQEKRIRGLEKEIDQEQKAGEFIYEHYQDFQKLIDSVRELREKGVSFEEIEKKLSQNKHFKKLDGAKKTIIMSWDK